MIRVLTGATVIDGTGAAPVADTVIVIDGERIAAAGPRQGLSWPGDAEIVDVRGKTIIPGLIDAHDHMASHGYALATRFGLDEPASTAHLRTAACSPRRSPWATPPSATAAGSTQASSGHEQG